MNEYGRYKGGTGNDKFIIYQNFAGKKGGYKLIIDDFRIKEDCLDFRYINTKLDNIKINNTKIMTKNSIELLDQDNHSLVTLMGIEYRFVLGFKTSSLKTSGIIRHHSLKDSFVLVDDHHTSGLMGESMPDLLKDLVC
jgi:hypothetical protein